MARRASRSAFLPGAALRITSPPRSPRTCRMCAEVDLSSPPPTGTLAERLAEIANSALRPLPKPVGLRRGPLTQSFAVGLMRAGYNAVDEVDIVAMDEYQRVFFDVRSRAWETYRRDNVGVTQGVLAEARYFDFISYAQMLATHRFVRAPRAVFEEAYAQDDGVFSTRIVRRDTIKLPGPSAVLSAFRREAGRRVLDAIALSGAGEGGALDAIKAVYAAFEEGGFCMRVDLIARGMSCDVEMLAPATLWGERALRLRKGIPNEYDVWAGRELLRSIDWDADVSTQITQNSIRRKWVLRERESVGLYT